jgi:hypothetical protein
MKGMLAIAALLTAAILAIQVGAAPAAPMSTDATHMEKAANVMQPKAINATPTQVNLAKAADTVQRKATSAKPMHLKSTKTAYGCKVWFTNGLPNDYCVLLSGSGTYVSYVKGNFALTGAISNWSITAEFFDTSGRWYQTYSSPIHYGTAVTNWDTISIGRWMRPGLMCSTLKSNGNRINSVCHSIN